MILFFILCTVLILAAITDLRSQKIPNWLTFPAVFSGIAFHSFSGGFSGFLLSIEGLLLGILFLTFFYILGGMGAGDVKLMGSVGALLGPKGVFIAFLATALVGGVYALVLLAFRGELVRMLKRYWLIMKTVLLTKKISYIPPTSGEKQTRLRYGVAIALGTMLSVVMSNSIYGMFHLN